GFKTVIALKVAQSFLQLSGNLRTANGALVTMGGLLATTRGKLSTFAAGIDGVSTRQRAANGAALTFASTLRMVGALMARIPALAIISDATYALTDLLSGWTGGGDRATTDLDEHERVMQKDITAYEEAKEKAE